MKKILAAADKILVVEDGNPMLENKLKELASDAGLAKEIIGRGSKAVMPTYDELNPDLALSAISELLGIERPSADLPEEILKKAQALTVPPFLCSLCRLPRNPG